MRKVFKWMGIILGGLVGLVILALAVVYFLTEAQLNQTYNVTVEPIKAPTDPTTLKRGQYLVTTIGFCGDCHGKNLAGQAFDDGPMIGRIVMPNLTAGKGGIGARFTDVDWVRALRHGLRQDNKPLIDMPSNYYYYLSDADLGAVIAYLNSLPPVDNELPAMQLGPVARGFILSDPSLLPAQVIDHTGPRPSTPKPGATVEYGGYLVTFCKVCHGDDLAGEPDAGAGQNLTPGGNLGKWAEADFIRTIRTGVTPEGRKLDPEMMPWNSLGKMNDDDLKAIWLYLQTLPAVETRMNDAEAKEHG